MGAHLTDEPLHLILFVSVPLNFSCNAYHLEAMINVLERKGILTSKEVLDEMEVIVAAKGKKEVN